MSNALLKVKNITKEFGNLVAVRGVNFEVPAGEIFSLIGPNGSGKTTIIKMIAGLLKPTRGEVLVDNFLVDKDPIRTKGSIGYIPDEPEVWPAMMGEEFLHFVAALYGVRKKTYEERISELLSIFRLRGLEKGYFEDYSRGNRQKFSIVAALIHKPKLLLIDEPIVGLDPQSAEVVKQQFVKFAKHGGAILMATHTLSVAEEISTRVGLLKHGELVAAGSLDILRSHVPLGSSKSLEDIYMALAPGDTL